MFGLVKRKIKNLIINSINETLIKSVKNDFRCSPSVKIQQRALQIYYKQLSLTSVKLNPTDTGYRVYSQFNEDGILLYIFSIIGEGKKLFVDIGSGDGKEGSNCANLAINLGWTGLFIDGNENRINTGIEYYRNHPDTWAYPPKFLCSFVNCENINDVIKNSGIRGEIDLLSIDLDGNDYWIWNSIEIISPRVVIIETHVEFGFNNIVVPYDRNYVYPGENPDYHGASPCAMIKLAKKKGYRLVGANNYGFNTIYVKNDVPEDLIPETTVEEILKHPRNQERFKLFDPIKNRPYIYV